jgi:hypothetical protein
LSWFERESKLNQKFGSAMVGSISDGLAWRSVNRSNLPLR